MRKLLRLDLGMIAGITAAVLAIVLHLLHFVEHIRADTEHKGTSETLLSFWGEPFMARTVENQVPRYMFWVHGHSDLVAQLIDLERQHRM